MRWRWERISEQLTEAHHDAVPSRDRRAAVPARYISPSCLGHAGEETVFPRSDRSDVSTGADTDGGNSDEASRKSITNAKVVFIGPCAAKKLEALRRSVRSDVDFVVTFEELDAMFEARGIDPRTIESQGHLHDATAAGRGYAVAGGVSASGSNDHEYYPDVEVQIEHVEGLDEVYKVDACKSRDERTDT